MATDIEGGVARIEAALNTPTLKLLDRKSAVIAMPLLSAVFPDDSQPVQVEQFHTRIDALLDDLRAGGCTTVVDGCWADFGRDIDSILMGPEAYEAYEPFGTELDQTGRALRAGNRRPVERLTAEERVVYLRLLDPQHTGHRRVEQERIPLARALEEVELVRRRFDRREVAGALA
ncbi:Wadjet anti-phage system protein JetD domain-containing protein [Pseudarthrobacter sp. NPDC092439]|uniref:Wadjet anti-phage system protein JetD domain-containing protein n=1 Tax=unclassified Pseudarthrobacter TaxID=2647000 RepID=UPI0037FAFB6C